MVDMLAGLEILAAQGVPGDSISARLAVPIGALVFYGSIYLLLRAAVGTRRAYLVFATSFFGFMIILSLFWTFGAPGTPPAVGPTYLPTQPSDAYQPKWTPFAQDSLVAERPEYAFVKDYPDGFGEVPADFERQAASGADSIAGFFGESAHQPGDFEEDWEPVEIVYAEAPNDFPVIAVTYEPPAEEGEEAAEGGEAEGGAEEEVEPVTLYGFFDPGAPLFPGIVFIVVSLVGFLLHVFLLNADERREQRELAEAAEEEREKVPAGA